MPRKARVTVVGAVHHIMSRGIEGKKIFFDDEDRNFFLNHLENLLVKTGYLLYAWCLMENHYHLLIRVNDYPLGAAMRALNGRYAQYFRKKGGTRGYLFQDRYKSIVTQDQHYIEEMVRYIHLNPIRAGLCSTIEELDTYSWSGHAVIVGMQSWCIQNTHDVLKRFAKQRKKAIVLYRGFLKAGLDKDPAIYTTIRKNNLQSEHIHNAGCWVIGNKEFVSKAVADDKVKRTRLARYAKENVTLKEVVRKISKQWGIADREIMKRGRNNIRSDTRKACAYICNRYYHFPVIQIAQYFNISSPSVSKMISEGERLVKDNNTLRY
jgi:REP element-mobilizing transposase RayT/AraC-like DNA-binding protein